MFVKGFDRRRECGIVLAGQGNRCAAAKPALTSTPRLLDSILASLEYWITRMRG